MQSKKPPPDIASSAQSSTPSSAQYRSGMVIWFSLWLIFSCGLSGLIVSWLYFQKNADWQRASQIAGEQQHFNMQTLSRSPDLGKLEQLYQDLNAYFPLESLTLRTPGNHFRSRFPPSSASWLGLPLSFGLPEAYIKPPGADYILRMKPAPIHVSPWIPALAGTFIALLMLSLHWWWQRSLQNRMEFLELDQRLPQPKFLRPLAFEKGFADLARSLSDQAEASETARKNAEKNLRRHQRQLRALVEKRTADLVKLNKRFLEEQFDAKTSALEAKQARWEAEKANQDKTRFLAAASHDLRQPLHAMSLFTEALKPHLESPKSHIIHHNLQRSLETMKGLFESLLDISKLEAGVLKPDFQHFALQPLFDRLEVVFRPLAHTKNLDLRLFSTGYHMHSDPVLVERVLSNLLSNAIKYTDAGYVVLGCRREGQQLRLFVWDSGPGIPAANHTEIFNEFVQLSNPERDRSKGLGLGLSIVKRTCALLQSEIRFQSAVGRGTRISLTGSMGREQGSKPVLTELATISRYAAGQSILVIDDDLEILLGTRALLEGWGWQPVLARSAEEAIQLCEKRQQPPDLIISDLTLQDNITGLEAIRGLHDHYKNKIPAVLITGDISPTRLAYAHASSYPVLHKPIKPAQLRSVCHAALHPETSQVDGSAVKAV